MSRNFDRVHKNSKLVKQKLQLSAGLGHYPRFHDSEDVPTYELEKSHIRYVLKLLDLGHKKVNFWVRRNHFLISNKFLDEIIHANECILPLPRHLRG